MARIGYADLAYTTGLGSNNVGGCLLQGGTTNGADALPASMFPK